MFLLPAAAAAMSRCLSISLSCLAFRVACGIIARSAGLFENPKKVCTCSGVTLWEEKQQLGVPQRLSPHL